MGPCSNSEIINRETFGQQFSYCQYIIILPPLLNNTQYFWESFCSKCMVHNMSRLEHCYGTHISNISRLLLTHWPVPSSPPITGDQLSLYMWKPLTMYMYFHDRSSSRHTTVVYVRISWNVVMCVKWGEPVRVPH